MKIGLIIVGDEILSGRRTDQHLPKIVSMLNQRGLQLDWVKIIGDDEQLLEDTFRQSFASDDLVFSTGGIGATPDDLTREAVARALEIVTERHREAVAILENRASQRGRKLNNNSYKLIEFPVGATLIENPVNAIPGFSMGDHHFVPGFPEMAWPMIEGLLDNRYQQLGNSAYVERALSVTGKYEGELIPLMEAINSKYFELKVFCLPTMKNDLPVNEIGLKGDLAKVDKALAELKQRLTELGCDWKNID